MDVTNWTALALMAIGMAGSMPNTWSGMLHGSKDDTQHCVAWPSDCQHKAQQHIETIMRPTGHHFFCDGQQCFVRMETSDRVQVIDVLRQLDQAQLGIVELDTIERKDDGEYHIRVIVTLACTAS